jgi:hypothetical protein
MGNGRNQTGIGTRVTDGRTKISPRYFSPFARRSLTTVYSTALLLRIFASGQDAIILSTRKALDPAVNSL